MLRRVLQIVLLPAALFILIVVAGADLMGYTLYDNWTGWKDSNVWFFLRRLK